MAAAEGQKDALRLARLLALEHARLIEGAHQLLIGLTHLPAVRRLDASACSRIFAEVLGEFPFYSNIAAVKPNGDIFCSALPLPGAINIADREHFQRALATRRFVASRYLVARTTGKPTAIFAYPAVDPSGLVDVVVTVLVDLRWFNRLAEQAQLPEGSTASLIDEGGVILAHHPAVRGRASGALEKAPIVQAVLSRRAEGAVEASGADGVRRLYAYSRLPAPAESGETYVSLGIPTAVVFADANRARARALLRLWFVTGLALLAAWVFSDLVVLRRVRAIVRATRRLATGDLAARTGLPHRAGSDELGLLAHSFDDMAAALQERTAERTKAEGARAQLEEQLRQAQKMEAIGRLAGGVAHEFNNLLTVIQGRGELLLHHLEAGDPRRRDVELINRAVWRAAALTQQLLAFSRKQVLRPTILDPNAVIGDLIKMMVRVIGEDIEVVTRFDPGVGQVRADRGQLEQALMNLAVNARDAMATGGRLTIATAPVELDGAFARAHPGAPIGPCVMLAVSDTGAGVEPETQIHIFEPFFTTKGVGQGTGLGLSTVYGIVEQHGGCVVVESAPGTGSTFRIYLPRAEQAVGGTEQGAPGVVSGAGWQTILLVEDEGEVRKLTAEILRMSGYTVLEAAGPSEALMLCERSAAPVHLLVTDVIMPRMNGRELALQLAALHPRIRVLYVSGYPDEILVDKGVFEPGTALLMKPFTAADLTRKVREVLGSRPGG